MLQPLRFVTSGGPDFVPIGTVHVPNDNHSSAVIRISRVSHWRDHSGRQSRITKRTITHMLQNQQFITSAGPRCSPNSTHTIPKLSGHFRVLRVSLACLRWAPAQNNLAYHHQHITKSAVYPIWWAWLVTNRYVGYLQMTGAIALSFWCLGCLTGSTIAGASPE